MSIVGKSCRCEFCGERYEIDWNDHDISHERFCGGDCQYAGEVLPDFIRSTTGKEREKFEKELRELCNKRRRFQ